MNERILEEVETVNAIYENAVEYDQRQSLATVNVPEKPITIKLWLPLQYPDEAPKVNSVSGVNSDQQLAPRFQSVVDETFIAGEVYLFTFIDEIGPLCDELMSLDMVHSNGASGGASITVPEKGPVTKNDWFTTEEIRDRGSVFTGRAIAAFSEKEANELVDELLKDRKLSTAAHNMVAWRILTPDGIAQSFDNDFEKGSGTTMLHVLDMSDAQNVVVVVTRFFGGTHLGSDRFRHIKNCTRDALLKGNFIKRNDVK